MSSRIVVSGAQWMASGVGSSADQILIQINTLAGLLSQYGQDVKFVNTG